MPQRIRKVFVANRGEIAVQRVVENHQLDAVVLREFDPVALGEAGDGRIAGMLQNPPVNLEVVRIVVNNQDPLQA